jgi:hypothetical protein
MNSFYNLKTRLLLLVTRTNPTHPNLKITAQREVIVDEVYVAIMIIDEMTCYRFRAIIFHTLLSYNLLSGTSKHQ